MYVELFIILFVIALSFILCMSDKGYNCQMSHILMGLSVLLIYKVVKYLNLFQNLETFKTKEKFDDNLTSAINQFVGLDSGSIAPDSIQATALTPQQLAIYNQNLADLNNKLSNLQDLLVNPPTQDSTTDLTTNINSLDLQALQQYQNFQIDYLQKQIQNAQNIINNQNIIESSSNYKPIKVLSSCNINSQSNNIPSQTVNPQSLQQSTTPTATSTGVRNPAQQNILSSILSALSNPSQ